MSKQGIHVPEHVRTQGEQMLRSGKTPSEVATTLNVSTNSTRRWRAELGPKKTPKSKKPKAKSTNATAYLAKQLEIIARMIQTKLPELAKFSLSVTADGDAGIEYTVRQTTLASGSVKL